MAKEGQVGRRRLRAQSPGQGHSQRSRVWRCRAPQSTQGLHLKGELSPQWTKRHSGNQPGSQPQWVSATAEQFFRATWEAGRRAERGVQTRLAPEMPPTRN